MTAVAINLMLTELHAIRHDISDVKNRLADIKAIQATTLQHLGQIAGAITQAQVGIDRQATRLSRVEDRLGLIDA